MVDFAVMRRAMVDGQVRTRDVTDLRLLAAMLDLPRERFVPRDDAALAYLDRDILVSAPGRPPRYLLKPMVLAKLVQAADVRETDRVLDIGCATGYSSAVLGRLARDVVALESDAELARSAAATLTALGAANTKVVTGPLQAGWPADGPYNVIVLEGATEVPPATLQDQLAENGRLVCVLRRGLAGSAMLYRVLEGEWGGRPIFDAVAAVLPGYAKAQEFVF
jgi:protein-L-isoaspartate(D-aspartate) O-methyltransferase